jgi:hypothetical protein
MGKPERTMAMTMRGLFVLGRVQGIVTSSIGGKLANSSLTLKEKSAIEEGSGGAFISRHD